MTNVSAEPQILCSGARAASLSTLPIDYLATLSEVKTNHLENPSVGPTASSGVPKAIANMLDDALTDQERASLLTLLTSYQELFDIDGRPLTRTSLVYHQIHTGSVALVRGPPHRTSPAERREISQQIADMLEKKIIEPSSSSWSSPVVLVKKKDGSWRFCADYRRLNKVTTKDDYPLPQVDDILDSLQGSSYFATINFRSGYCQMPIHAEGRPKTAFVTPDELSF